MAAIILMAAIGAWAVVTGQVSYVATYGVSMHPLYYQGDLVFVVKEDSYQVGQIVAYHGTQPGQKVLHRIIGGDAATGFVFKGDNNQSVDPVHPKADRLIGRAFLHLPKGELWLHPLLSPSGLGMLSFLFVSGSGGPRSRREIPRGRRKKKVKAMSQGSSPQAMLLALARGAMRLPPAWRAAAAMSALTAVLGVAFAVLGWIKPVTVTRTTGSAQSLNFSYSAQVPRSPAYDGTVVNGPDPIFRKLAHQVAVQMRYAGPPGSFAVRTTLSATSGWHTTLPGEPATTFSGTVFDRTVGLDLTAIQRRVEAAAKAIELDPGTVTVGLYPVVKTPDGGTYSASLGLALNPMTLTLSEGSLKNVSTPSKETLLRTIGFFGHPFMTAGRARAMGSLLLLLGAAGGIIIALFARRAGPVRTREEIERRYPTLLVPVEPMMSPPGKPVVNVGNFPALVKLAERYGQMILTWRRPDADDFVVRDEGITYRYRVPLDEPTLQNVELIDRPPGAGSHRRKATFEVS
ncbi:signal peptidase I [Actinoplanes sp. NPDC051343]|uniref:signal peptidase I n=1 Tax=Actinoplanes sp. NPDC051343 TaxID=3363906 RepID=UPI0037951295